MNNFVSDLRQTGLWFSPGTPVSSNNKTDRHDIAEILLKVSLNTNKTGYHVIRYTGHIVETERHIIRYT